MNLISQARSNLSHAYGWGCPILKYEVRGPDGPVVWGTSVSFCDLQAAGSILVAARACNPPHHRAFGDHNVAMGSESCIYDVERNIRAIWADNDLNRPKIPIIIHLKSIFSDLG